MYARLTFQTYMFLYFFRSGSQLSALVMQGVLYLALICILDIHAKKPPPKSKAEALRFSVFSFDWNGGLDASKEEVVVAIQVLAEGVVVTPDKRAPPHKAEGVQLDTSVVHERNQGGNVVQWTLEHRHGQVSVDDDVVGVIPNSTEDEVASGHQQVTFVELDDDAIRPQSNMLVPPEPVEASVVLCGHENGLRNRVHVGGVFSKHGQKVTPDLLVSRPATVLRKRHSVAVASEKNVL
jgi:hypothetical protein